MTKEAGARKTVCFSEQMFNVTIIVFTALRPLPSISAPVDARDRCDRASWVFFSPFETGSRRFTESLPRVLFLCAAAGSIFLPAPGSEALGTTPTDSNRQCTPARSCSAEQVHCRVSESIVHSTFYLALFLQGKIYQTAEWRLQDELLYTPRYAPTNQCLCLFKRKNKAAAAVISSSPANDKKEDQTELFQSSELF